MALVAIVLLVLIGFFVIRGMGRGGSAGSSGKGSIEINVPKPSAPGK